MSRAPLWPCRQSAGPPPPPLTRIGYARRSSPTDARPAPTAGPQPAAPRRWRRAALACLATLGLGLPLAAPAELVDGPDGTVYAIARGADGSTYLGGSFYFWGTETGGFASLSGPDGAVNKAFPLVGGMVWTIVADGSGGWYIGGRFSSVGGLPRANLAHIDASGSVTDWAPAVNPPGEYGGAVLALALGGDTLYVGGSFESITPPGGTAIPRANLAAIRTTDTGSLTDWAPAADYGVSALALDGATLYAGGYFTNITPPGESETPRNLLAAIRTDDTGSLTPWAPHVNGDDFPFVSSLAVSDSILYVGGDFSSITPPGGSETPRVNLAAIRTTDNGSLTDWSPSPNNSVQTLVVAGSNLYAGGWFTNITPPGGSEIARAFVAAIRTDDSGSLTDWAPAVGGGVFALAVGNTTLYAGGYFGTITPPGGNAIQRGSLAEISIVDNGSVTGWNPAVDADVNALAVQGGTVAVGGYFQLVGKRRDSLAALDTNGLLRPWAPAVYGSVNALTINGSRLYVGGNFTKVTPPDGTASSRNNLAAIQTDDGGSLTDWAPEANGEVNVLTLSGSTLYAGGSFTSITPPGDSATLRSHLAAIRTADTGSLTDWAPAANNDVNALALSGATLFAGGQFTSISPPGGSVTTRNRLAAIRTTDTGTLTDWAPGADSSVYALAISGDTLYAGGSFTTITPSGGSASPRARLAAMRTKDNGSLTAWAPSANAAVNALTLSGSTLYLGGEFSAITPPGGSATTRNLLAAISVADNGGVMNWDPSAFWDIDFAFSVSALAIDDDTVIAGGDYFSITNELQPNSPTSYLSFLHTLPCSSGTALTPGTWQQPALPCQPDAAPATVTGTLGTAPAANLPAAAYGSQWVVNQRPVTATGWSRLGAGAPLAQGAGYALRSNVAAVGEVLAVAGTPTPVVTGDPDCPSANGCFIAMLHTGAEPLGDKLLGNPFPYDLDWSAVRVRDGLNLYTPTEAEAAGLMARQAWVWNGTAYQTFADTAPVAGRLPYGQAFWTRLLPGANGKTLELLLPARQAGPEVLTPATGDWRVRLTLRHATTGASTEARIGQWTGAEEGRDGLDLLAMTPFAAPWLSLTVPHTDWGSARGDYVTDLRMTGGTGATWPINLRADRPGTAVVLTWDGEPAVLANSRLRDGNTLIDLAAYPDGYPLTLTGKVKQLTWEYLGSD